MSDTQSDPLVNVTVVAKHLGFSERHIREMAAQGLIPAFAIKNGARTYWRFNLAKVVDFMDTQQDIPASTVSAIAVMGQA